ncbi:MAG: hypothetical protein ACYCSP_02540 [Acidobacteriaceae bacterium]
MYNESMVLGLNWKVISTKMRGLSLSILAVSAALLGALGVFISTLVLNSDRDRATRLGVYETAAILSKESAKDREELRRLSIDNQALRSTLIGPPEKQGSVQYSQGLNPSDRLALANVVAAQADLNKRLSSLESALSSSPDKAIALPLLKQQITDMQEKNRGDFAAVHDEMGGLFTLLEWGLGLLITLIIGVGGIIINIIRGDSSRLAATHHSAKT